MFKQNLILACSDIPKKLELTKLTLMQVLPAGKPDKMIQHLFSLIDTLIFMTQLMIQIMQVELTTLSSNILISHHLSKFHFQKRTSSVLEKET
jgi:hypothetical protein